MKYFILLTAIFICFNSCRKKTDPVLPAKQEFIEADIKFILFDVYPGRKVMDGVFLSFDNPKTGQQYDIDLSFVTKTNCTVHFSTYELFLTTTFLFDTSYKDIGSFSVKGINDAVDLIIDVAENVEIERTGYLQTKKYLLHFTAQTEVAFQEFNAKDIQPYIKPDGLEAAKTFYESLIKKDMTNAVLSFYTHKRD